MTEFFEARIRADWLDWTFAAHQAASRAADAEALTTLRRQYTDLSEPDLQRLAQSWRSDSASGPYFTFTAADATPVSPSPTPVPTTEPEPTQLALDATFVQALFHELEDRAPSALTALLDHWTDQRRHATRAALHRTPSPPPRVALLLPRDPTTSPPHAWPSLRALDLAAPTFDSTILRWDNDSALWQPAPLQFHS